MGLARVLMTFEAGNRRIRQRAPFPPPCSGGLGSALMGSSRADQLGSIEVPEVFPACA